MATKFTERLDFKIDSNQKELINYALSLTEFKSISEFIRDCIVKESNKIIAESNQILKSIDDKKIFVDAILNPKKPSNKLIEANVKYNEFKNN